MYRGDDGKWIIDEDADGDWDLIGRIYNAARAKTGEDTNFSANNRDRLKEYYLKTQDCRCILEIGVENNPNKNFTSTRIFLDNKLDTTCYIGVDIEDRSHIQNPDKNIFIIRSNSVSVQDVVKFVNEKGHKEIDFLFIDGWHSINSVRQEFYGYTPFLSKNGIVGIHDTNHHPGPRWLLDTIDRNVWEVDEFTGDPNIDFGIAFLWRRIQI